MPGFQPFTFLLGNACSLHIVPEIIGIEVFANAADQTAAKFNHKHLRKRHLHHRTVFDAGTASCAAVFNYATGFFPDFHLKIAR